MKAKIDFYPKQSDSIIAHLKSSDIPSTEYKVLENQITLNNVQSFVLRDKLIEICFSQNRFMVICIDKIIWFNVYNE